ncbi:TetR family transcriptional regulator [Kitasatospora albolonga]|uniref:TetR family transcriptional regulator n=1 Tax=Kitasatospora albolonga TaxID=68173 RepID=A0ABC8BY34_9ACTN|nr:TetR family transcriptional regulator [Kitasatospora albolonga]
MPTAREALLDAALRALAERPWRTVRMVEVAALAGVSRQTLYNEFGTKGGLATALLRRAADGYLAGVDRALAAPAPEHPAAVAHWTVRAAREDPLVRGLLTGLWGEWSPRPGHEVPAPAQLLGLARDRMVAASETVTPPLPPTTLGETAAHRTAAPGSVTDGTAGPRTVTDRAAAHRTATDRAAAHRTAVRCETVLRLALSYVIVPGDFAGPRSQCAEPDSWSPITPMITSEIDTSFSVETTSPRKTMP